MSPAKAKLQRLVLSARSLPYVNSLFLFYYRLSILAFRWAANKTEVRSIYLRRGGGRGELVPGASDLDFFLVLNTLPAEREMEFLKAFWRSYRRLRVPFPFLGEVLMGDQNELSNWLSAGTVRAFETSFSWKLIAGEDLARSRPPLPPSSRDLFSEALKHYGDLLQIVLKIRPEQFTRYCQGSDPGASHIRNAAKAALDLFRLHATATGSALNLWQASRAELTALLPTENYGAQLPSLRPLLSLERELFREEPLALFSGLVHTALRCLEEMAELLGREHEVFFEGSYEVAYGSARKPDAYSLSVRELFAERILFRHEAILSRAILSETTAGIYFPLTTVPTVPELRALLEDLREVSFSLERLSVVMPITELAYRELERTSLLDTPFHSFGAHREIRMQGGEPKSSSYPLPAVRIPESQLRKSFAELSFALRLEPRELEHFLDKIVALVLGLRLAGEQRQVSTNFHQALARYGERYPLRHAQLKHQLYPYVKLELEGEDKVWEGIYARLNELAEHSPEPATLLRERLEEIRSENAQLSLSKTVTSDLWINLTPFLRMEMNTMKERYFEERPPLSL